MKKLETYAKKTFVALKDPFHTVCDVNPLVLNQVSSCLEEWGYAYYTGVKNTGSIPQSLLNQLENRGFLLHTKDVMAPGGRAIDVYHRNPLTDRFMTGSSSGTALNVFYHINDLGIGTDGGGSVLAPAASLNLFGFISPLIAKEELVKFEKKSTDGISFTPSLGFITREWPVLEEAIYASLNMPEPTECELVVPIGFDCPGEGIYQVEYIDTTQDREVLMDFLKQHVKENRILLSMEGPVDVYGIGDTVFGHHDEKTKKCQKESGKGFMRVVNMCGFSAVSIPQRELGCCVLLICQSNEQDIASMLNLGKMMIEEKSELIQKYFSNLDMYL